MKKIVALLEQNVQWLALALGLGYALFMTWTYVIVPPVVVEEIKDSSGAPVGPGNIDKEILNGVAQDLDAKIKDGSVREPKKLESYVTAFTDEMTFKNQPATPFADAMILWPQTPLVKAPDPSVNPNPNPFPRPDSGTGTVTELPKIPAAQIVAARAGTTYIVTPGQNADPAAGAVVGMDKNWVTVLYAIDASALARQWEQSKLPGSNVNTVFLQVVLERQEMKPDGTWSEPLKITPPAVATDAQSFPPQGTAAAELVNYSQWATGHQPEILRPQFFNALKGEKWAPPGLEGAVIAEGQPQQAFDPNRYLKATPQELLKLSLEERQKVSALKLKLAAEAQRGRGPAPRRGVAAPAEAPAEVAPAPLDEGRPANFQVAQPPAGPAIAPPATQPQPPRNVASLQPSQIVGYPIPSGEFDPTKWETEHPGQSQLVGWAIDDTVIPGRSYRYRVSYKLKNPVLFTISAVKDSKLADKFALESPPTNWSDSIEVTSGVSFWIARATPDSAVAAIQVFRRQGGDTKSKTYTVSAGDAIGGKEGTLDYSTGWTFVDLRKDPRGNEKAYVLLMDSAGTIHRRDPEADAQDPKFQQMKSQISAAPGNAAQVAR